MRSRGFLTFCHRQCKLLGFGRIVFCTSFNCIRRARRCATRSPRFRVESSAPLGAFGIDFRLRRARCELLMRVCHSVAADRHADSQHSPHVERPSDDRMPTEAATFVHRKPPLVPRGRERGPPHLSYCVNTLDFCRSLQSCARRPARSKPRRGIRLLSRERLKSDDAPVLARGLHESTIEKDRRAAAPRKSRPKSPGRDWVVVMDRINFTLADQDLGVDRILHRARLAVSTLAPIFLNWSIAASIALASRMRRHVLFPVGPIAERTPDIALQRSAVIGNSLAMRPRLRVERRCLPSIASLAVRASGRNGRT